MGMISLFKESVCDDATMHMLDQEAYDKCVSTRTDFSSTWCELDIWQLLQDFLYTDDISITSEHKNFILNFVYEIYDLLLSRLTDIFNMNICNLEVLKINHDSLLVQFEVWDI